MPVILYLALNHLGYRGDGRSIERRPGDHSVSFLISGAMGDRLKERAAITQSFFFDFRGDGRWIDRRRGDQSLFSSISGATGD